MNNLFAAVDVDYNFPPEICKKLSLSLEFKNHIIPMSKTVQDNLTSNYIWPGRTIYNTTTQSLETWSAVKNSWLQTLNEDFVVPEPPKPWDLSYTLPEAVQTRLALSSPLKYFIAPVTSIQRDNFVGSELWVGRTVYNISTKQLESWDGLRWASYYLTSTDSLNRRISWTPKLFLYPSQRTVTPIYTENLAIKNFQGWYYKRYDMVYAVFSLDLGIHSNTQLNLEKTGEEYRITPPILPYDSKSSINIGNAYINAVSYDLIHYYPGLVWLDPASKSFIFEAAFYSQEDEIDRVTDKMKASEINNPKAKTYGLSGSITYSLT